MFSRSLNNRASSLLLVVTLFGSIHIWSEQKQELPKIKPCSRPAIANGYVNCDGVGELASGMFLLFETKIDLNKANAAELALIPKLQKKVAAAIIEKRQELGSFSSFKQIDEVRGVGPKILERIKEHCSLIINVDS